MSNIEKFISDVDAEVFLTLRSHGITPNPKNQLSSLKRLSEKYPELKIDPEREVKIITYIRLALNARNN